MTKNLTVLDDANCPRLVICIATFQRPNGLARVLTSLMHLETDGFQPHLVVIDNDASGAARSTFDAHVDSLPFDATYLIEPTRGIASARNRSVAAARELGAEYVLFTDDDVRVGPDWAKESVHHAMLTGADVVIGRQLYEFENDVPMRIRRAIAQPQKRNGEAIIPFTTANCLIRLSSLYGIAGPFDTNFSFSGGSDKMLAAQLKARGKSIEYLPKSIVYEQVPDSRAKTSWVLKRGYRNGMNSIRIRLIMAESHKGAFVNGLKTVVRQAPILGRWLWNLGLDKDNRLLYLKGLCSFAGVIHGLVTPGAVYSEYETTHGD